MLWLCCTWMFTSNFPTMELSSFNSNKLCYSYAWSSSLNEGRTSFSTWLFPEKFWRFLLMFSIGFTLFSVHSLSTCILFLALFCLFHQAQTLSQNLVLLYLLLKTLTSTIKTGLITLMGLICLVNSATFFNL